MTTPNKVRIKLPTTNKARIKLLVDALRSKKYQQAAGRLHVLPSLAEAEGYCCLGVACEVAIANGLDLKSVIVNDVVHRYGQTGVTSALPSEVSDWYGFDRANPWLSLPEPTLKQKFINFLKCQPSPRTPATGEVSATEANDVLELPFHAIADAFERTYLK